MSIELYQVPAQTNTEQATDELLVSDRSTVAGTGWRTLAKILRVMANYVGALTNTDLVPVKTASGTGWRSIQDIVNAGPISQQAASNTRLVIAGITGDASFRVALYADGTIGWANGTSGVDANLYRSAAGTLKTDGNLDIAGDVTSTGKHKSVGSTGYFLHYYDAFKYIGMRADSTYARIESYEDGVGYKPLRLEVSEVIVLGGVISAANPGEVVIGNGRFRAYENIISEAGDFYAAANRGLLIGSTYRFTGNASYTHVRSPDGTTRMYITDSTCYFDNDNHYFRNHAGTIDGNVYMGNLYRSGSLQPASQVGFTDIGASTYTTILATPDYTMWELTVGNGNDGYMAKAVFGKPSASVATVLLSEVHSHADLTISLSGNDVHINNGVAGTRTIFYVLTKLY